MLSSQGSTSSLSTELASWSLTTPEPSWLDTSRSPSLVSSISERSTKCHDQVHVEAPLWRTFFAGRSRSVPHLSAISSPPLIMRTGSADHGEKSSLIGMNPSTREQSKRTTRFYLRGTWRNNRESTTLNGSSVSLDQATSQETKDMSSSRSSSLFRKSNRPFSRAFRELLLSTPMLTIVTLTWLARCFQTIQYTGIAGTTNRLRAVRFSPPHGFDTQ